MEFTPQFVAFRRGSITASPWLLCAVSIISFSSFIIAFGEPSAPPPNDTSLLCISKCDTCPLICSPPPSPPLPPPPPPPDDSSFLCISKCGTCPVICAPPPPQLQLVSSPPPPPPGMTYITVDGPSPSPPLPRPPPPKSTHPPPTSEDGQKGGLSYPYYYFYTASEATRSRLVSGEIILRLFAVAILSFSISLFVR